MEGPTWFADKSRLDAFAIGKLAIVDHQLGDIAVHRLIGSDCRHGSRKEHSRRQEYDRHCLRQE